MSPRTIGLTAELAAYVTAHGGGVDDVLERLIAETSAMSQGKMQVAPEQGRFLGFLAEILGARRVIEVGTFTGYSSVCMARALPRGGQLVCLDQSEEWTAIAQKYWVEAGVSDRISLILGPAEQSLWHIVGQGLNGSDWVETVDMVFIDANKSAYNMYYDYALELLRPGGIVALDNVLWHGDVADPSKTDTITRHMRSINNKVSQDPRVSACLLPVGDGLMLARKL